MINLIGLNLQIKLILKSFPIVAIFKMFTHIYFHEALQHFCPINNRINES